MAPIVEILTWALLSVPFTCKTNEWEESFFWTIAVSDLCYMIHRGEWVWVEGCKPRPGPRWKDLMLNTYDMHERTNRYQDRRKFNNLNGHPMRGKMTVGWPMRRKMAASLRITEAITGTGQWPEGLQHVDQWQEILPQPNIKKRALWEGYIQAVFFTNGRKDNTSWLKRIVSVTARFFMRKDLYSAIWRPA